MAFFDWDDKYSVKIQSIDLQHKKLFELISHFYEMLRQKHTEQAMRETLQGLVEYAHIHFTTEENYLKKYQYPLYARHTAKHAEFVEKLNEFQARFQAKTLLIPIEIAEFMKQWLSEHVLGEDQQYAAFLQRHMPK